MKRLIADIHTHTLVSGHAYGTIREMAKAASERGLEVIGFSEHAPGIPGTVDPFYYLNLNAIPDELYGVNIINGCEINVLNDGSLSLEERYIERLDYAIAGIHTLCYKDEGKEKNTLNIISCMAHPKVKLISHPDDDHTPLDYQMLVKAAKTTSTALEVNSSSLRKKQFRINCEENYRVMLKLCEEYEVPIIVSSDAHDPSQVADFDEAQKLINECGFSEELILNNDKDKLFRFLFN